MGRDLTFGGHNRYIVYDMNLITMTTYISSCTYIMYVLNTPYGMVRLIHNPIPILNENCPFISFT